MVTIHFHCMNKSIMGILLLITPFVFHERESDKSFMCLYPLMAGLFILLGWKIPVANSWMPIFTFLLCFLMSFDERKKKVTWKQSYSPHLQLQTNVPPKGIHNMQINCCTGPSFLSEYRWRKQTAGMRCGGDPWSVHALKNTRMKWNQRIINILYRIQISLKWEFSLNAHLHRDHSFISFYCYLSVPLAVNRLSYLCRSLDSSGPS